MKEEIWKDIKNYEGLYQISNFGNLKSIKNGREKIIKQNYSQRYIRNNLWKKCKYKTLSIHRLVAEAFVPNPSNYKIVNHKDGNRYNNNATNLEWCTQSHNVKESYRLGLQKTFTPPMAKDYIPWNKGKTMSKEYVANHCNSKKVAQYDLEGNLINLWDSASEAQRTLKIGNITKCCRGERKTSYGFAWKYI